MKNTLRKTQFIMTMLFGLLFTSNINASSMECLPTTIESITHENISSIEDNLVFKDGKWKERWNSFLDGFLDGFKDGVGSINNPDSNGNNSAGFSNEELLQLNKFALQLKSKSAGLDLVYQLDQLIHDDSSVITEKQMLNVFKENDKILDIIKKAIRNSTFPNQENIKIRSSKRLMNSKVILKGKKRSINKDVVFIDKEKAPKRFWKVLGYAIGWIVGNIVKG